MNSEKIWAKSNGNDILPLWAHMIDATAVSEALFDFRFPKAVLNNVLKVNSFSGNDIKRLFSAFAGLHDIGKATPKFQSYRKDLFETEPDYGKYFGIPDGSPRHDYLSYLILHAYFSEKDQTKESRQTIDFLAKALYSHHGIFGKINPQKISKNKYGEYNSPIGSDLWKKIQFELIDDHFHSLGVDPDNIVGSNRKIERFLPAVAGWISLSDWIASDERYFPYDGDIPNRSEYFKISRDRARKAIDDIGLSKLPSVEIDEFDKGFPGFSPRPLQAICSGLLSDGSASLTIVEAPTGEGKTEAALHLAQRILKRSLGTGIYVAMPTQATSKGLYDRFEKFCENVDSGEINRVKLIHGAAVLDELIRKTRMDDLRVDYPDDDRFDWFAQKKRALLATYGVGTVDQSFFGVLLVKHFFLRLYALAGKVLIFDEVHAYDFFMLEIFKLLLKHLKTLGTSVVILSATLPTSVKKILVETWTEKRFIPSAEYPLITHATQIGENAKQEIFENSFPVCSERTIKLKFLKDDRENVVKEAFTAFSSGARVAVVCNSVDRAQKIYRDIREEISQIDDTDQRIYLLHSRLTKRDRNKVEKIVLDRFGKNSQSSLPAIVVGTQIIEQSLDIDFDYMISDIAPVDLLAQRVGRLHRHSIRDASRPKDFKEPTLAVSAPSYSPDVPPNFSKVAFVYDEITMLRTYYKIKDQTEWNFPKDYRDLVDSVYPEDFANPKLLFDVDFLNNLSDEEKDKFETAAREKENEDAKSKSENQLQSIPEPKKFSNIYKFGNFNFEDESGARKRLVAKTRQGEPSANACIFFERDGFLFTDTDFSSVFDLSNLAERNDDLAVRALMNSVGFSNKKLIGYLETLENPDWNKARKANRVLKNYFPLIIPAGGLKIDDSFLINYDKKLGLIFTKGE